MNPSNIWPDDEVKLLRKLFDEGLSSGDIAKQLPGRTRSAVIGKLGRLGLRLSPKATGPKPKPRLSRKRNGYNYRRAPWKPEIVEQFPATQAVDLPPEPVANPITFMELAAHLCRWPVHADGEPALFCGATSLDERPYCCRHCNIAYVGTRSTMNRASIELRLRQIRRGRAA